MLKNLLLVALAFAASAAHAVINFGVDNNGNVTDPGSGVPFNAVAQIYSNNQNDPRGTGVYLGNGYVLTARHVDINLGSGQVRFDRGGQLYDIDPNFTPTQVAPNVDLDIIRIIGDPGIPGVNLLSSPTEILDTATVTIVGWGRGRDPNDPVGTFQVSWGNIAATNDKRWGLNVLRGVEDDFDGRGSFVYDALYTILGAPGAGGVGANEAAVATLDSGGGLFQQINGDWYLVGIATEVADYAADTSSFFNDSPEPITFPPGGENYFVRVSSYAGDILAIIPEPSATPLIFGALGLLLLTRRRARRV
ncbi:MAG: trypsin-like serine protease [Verrucomicrobiota bacterium]